MRTTTIGNFSVTYPDANVWLYDNNVVKIETTAANTTVGAEIIVTALSSNITRTLRYIGDMNSIVFSLNDTLLNMFSGGRSFQASMTLYANGTASSQFGFTFNVFEGKSYPNRSHGAERTIYLYGSNTLIKVQLWATVAGQMTLNGNTLNLTEGYNAFDLRSILTDCGTYVGNFTVGNTYLLTTIDNVSDLTPSSGVVNITSTLYNDTPSTRAKSGGIWKSDDFNPDSYQITFVNDCSCENYDYVLFRYVNADGFERFIAGKLLDETASQEVEQYYRLDTEIYRNRPYNHITGTGDTIKVGFEDVERNAYLMDILTSPVVEYLNYAGEWQRCTIEDSDITVTSSDTQDYELTFCINRE